MNTDKSTAPVDAINLDKQTTTFSTFSVLTWNLEGLARNIFNLKHFLFVHNTDFAFISEPQTFQHDITRIMKPLHGEYKFALNSSDLFDPELPLTSSRAHGGTLVLWKVCHDPYVHVHPVPSSAILPIIFSPPGNPISIHISVYLPTHGKDSSFTEELSSLSVCLDELIESYPDSPIYISGDFNVNERNQKRTALLDQLCKEFDFLQTDIPHKTYHHFVGNGASDSNLDKILFTDKLDIPETIKKIECKLLHSGIDSHHDMLISSFSLPSIPRIKNSKNNIVAPKIENTRVKINWADDDIEKYQNVVTPELKRIQLQWIEASRTSRTSLSLLLESTNHALSKSAVMTNKSFMPAKQKPPRPKKTPSDIKHSANKLLKEHKRVKHAIDNSDPNLDAIRECYTNMRKDHRKLVRAFKAKDAVSRDTDLFLIKSKDPRPFFKKIRASKSDKTNQVKKLFVKDKTYLEERVCDGFYDSISSLKTRDIESLKNNHYFTEFQNDYQNILKICQSGLKIPPISEKKAFHLLQRMKPDVYDFYSITPNHFTYAGPLGWKHFHLLLMSLINSVNASNIEEINTIYAIVLYKRHNKNKQYDRSYRTISTCPVIAKAFDMYIRDLHISDWNRHQPECQFQGPGSSHELAAVLLTECIEHSLHQLKLPLFVLYLDAKSAFDVVLKELLVKNLFSIGTTGESLIYLNNRLDSRQTILDWNGQLMGPIVDELGLEQGGVSSAEFYKIFSLEQLGTAQASALGVPLGSGTGTGTSLTISGIGQADDSALVSNNIHALSCLLHLTEVFCSKYNVSICSEKTKLQVFHTKEMNLDVEYVKKTFPLKINDVLIEYSETAEHVGMIRSTSGNIPTLLARMTAHKKALGAVLHAGLAKSPCCYF